MNRCWGTGDLLAEPYHDNEWGVYVDDDLKHFEFLVLESFQAGLSWMTMLKKRENFRKAFDNFDPEKIAYYDENKILTLMQNAGIIRYRKKIEAAINNAKRFLEIKEEFGTYNKWFWHFTEGKTIHNHWKSFDEVPVKTELSDLLAKEFKDRGFKFFGSTTMYAHMQGVGMVNDHLVSCFRHSEILNKS